MNIDIPCQGCEGIFGLRKFQGYELDGKIIPIPGTESFIEFPNTITDVGLTAQMTVGLGSVGYADPGTLLWFAMVGNGTDADGTGFTALSSYLAGTNAYLTGSASTTTSSPYVDSVTRIRRFSPGFLGSSNVNITEVGMGSGNNTGTLFTRALIKDSGGTPVAITITPIDYLDVYYTIRLYKYEGPDITGQVSVAGVQTNFVLRSAEITSQQLADSSDFGNGVVIHPHGNYNGWAWVYPSTSTLGPITGRPTGVYGLSSSASTAAYSSGLIRQGTVNFSINDGNMSGGIGCALIRTTRGNFQISFSPPIPKDNTKTLAITLNIGPISRYTPP